MLIIYHLFVWSKFLFLAQFSVNHFSHPVVSIIIIIIIIIVIIIIIIIIYSLEFFTSALADGLSLEFE